MNNMTEEEIVASGLLELYVTGSLTEEETRLVEQALMDHPTLIKELEGIETSLISLSERMGGAVSTGVWEMIVGRTLGVRAIDSRPKGTNWSAMTGWAAAILFFGGLVWMMVQNNQLKSNLRTSDTKNVVLQEKVNQSETQLAEARDLLEVVRSKDFKAVNLPGNTTVSPDAYATVYYNEKENIAYIDAQGLPTPPKGKVYQVWSLVMEPLTPSSIGLLQGFDRAETKFFKVENIPTPEAFGITLEPEGGSETPTLDQLYTLGMVSP